MEDGIINYYNQVDKEGLDNKFIGKNFVFEKSLEKRISDDVISAWHQYGEPCNDHTNCINIVCHLLFIQSDKCKEKLEGCCSEECQEFIHLPEAEQKERQIRHKARNSYKKGRSPKLKFKK